MRWVHFYPTCSPCPRRCIGRQGPTQKARPYPKAKRRPKTYSTADRKRQKEGEIRHLLVAPFQQRIAGKWGKDCTPCRQPPPGRPPATRSGDWAGRPPRSWAAGCPCWSSVRWGGRTAPWRTAAWRGRPPPRGVPKTGAAWLRRH